MNLPPDDYQYVMINGRYYCLQQNPFKLAWHLYFNCKSFQLHTGPVGKRAFGTARALLKHRLHLRPETTVLNLPVFGNLCLKVHRGYKLFLFRKRIVTKLLGSKSSSDVVQNEIENARKAGALSFAPSVYNWNIEQKWYEEDFVKGSPYYQSPTSKTHVSFEIYHSCIAQYLADMIMLSEPHTVDLKKYVGKCVDICDNRLLSAKLDTNKVSIIKHFVLTTYKKINYGIKPQVELIFCHGDFSLVNILKTKCGPKVIDWEGAGNRSPLYDLYNYFFTELYYERAMTNLILEVNRAIAILQSRLINKATDMAASFGPFTAVYRRLFYIERIRMLLERDLNNRILDVVLRSIGIFKEFENATEIS